jgi:beta-carotene ketolase (CrtO type)
MESYDVVVVGGGVNGLTSACYLAKAGLSVAVVEARNECGAFASTEDLFGGGSPSDTHAAACFLPMSPVWKDLELDDYGLELILGYGPAAATWPDGKNLIYYYDRTKLRESVSRLSRDDAAVADQMWQKLSERLFDVLWLFFKPASEEGLKQFYELGELVGLTPNELRDMTGIELLDSLFKNEYIKMAWLAAGDIGLFGNVNVKGEGAVAVLLSSLLAIATPRNGMHNLTHALVRCLRDFKGTIYLNTPVEHVHLGRVPESPHVVSFSEASTVNVGEIGARLAVVFNVSPTLALQILGEDVVKSKDKSLYDKMHRWSSTGHCAFISHFLIHGLPNWNSITWNSDIASIPFVLRAWDSWEHAKASQSFYQVEDTIAVLGDIAEIYNQTSLDPSRVSREGNLTVSVEIEYPVSLVDYGGFKAWDDKEFSDRVHNAHAEMMEKIAPGFMNQIRSSTYFTPLDNWRRNRSAIYGHEIGGDNSERQWYLGRIPSKTSIPGIYFSQGIWPASLTHLGNGYVSACSVATDLGVRNKPWWSSAPMERFVERYLSKY